MKKMRLFFFSFILVWTQASSAGKAEDPCFRDKLPFFKNFEGLDSNPDSLRDMLTNSCKELSQKEMFEKKSLLEVGTDSYVKSIGFPVFGQGSGAFATMNSNEQQKKFKEVLDLIKQIRNPMTRIRLTYDLVAAIQGRYDYKSMQSISEGVKNMLLTGSNPEKLVDRAYRDGTVGVCREMASLLNWSLMQVSRHSESKSAQLGPNDFSANIETGTVPGADGWGDGGGHAWVRVNLPKYDSSGRLTHFNHFDLDTTWYPKKFSPLMPRRSDLSEANRQRAANECAEIRKCLLTRSVAEELEKNPPMKVDSSKRGAR